MLSIIKINFKLNELKYRKQRRWFLRKKRLDRWVRIRNRWNRKCNYKVLRKFWWIWITKKWYDRIKRKSR